MDLAKYSNVAFIRILQQEQVKRLYPEADFYLDINHREILSATRACL